MVSGPIGVRTYIDQIKTDFRQNGKVTDPSKIETLKQAVLDDKTVTEQEATEVKELLKFIGYQTSEHEPVSEKIQGLFSGVTPKVDDKTFPRLRQLADENPHVKPDGFDIVSFDIPDESQEQQPTPQVMPPRQQSQSFIVPTVAPRALSILSSLEASQTQEVDLSSLAATAKKCKTPEEFQAYVSEILTTKLNIKDENVAAVASNLYTLFTASDAGEKIKSLGKLVVSLNETESGKKALNKLSAQVTKLMPAPIQEVFKKLLREGPESEARIDNLAAVLDGNWEASDIQAIYELLNDFGPSVKALLPQKVKDHITRLETLMGKGFMEHVKSFLPTSSNSETAKTALTMIFGDGVDRVGAGIDFAKTAGVKLFGENGKFAAVMKFMEVDATKGAYLKQFLDPAALPQSRMDAGKKLAELYKTGIEELSTKLGEIAGRAGEVVVDVTKRESVSAFSKTAKLGAREESTLLRVLSESENAQHVLSALEGFEKSELETVIKILDNVDPKIIDKLFANAELAEKMLKYMTKLVPVFEKYGLKAVDALPKLAAGLGKAIPLLGAIPSAYDTVRLGAIAATGKWGEQTYSDPEVRALAVMGAGLNGLDTVLGVVGADVTGIGTVAEVGIALGEVAIDVMIDHFNEHPDKMPQSLRLGIKAAAMGAVLTTPVTGNFLGAAAVVNIYGLSGTVDIATELTSLLGQGALKGMEQEQKLKAVIADQTLEGLTGGINGMADVIRNPEKYAAILNKSVSEVTQEATEWLVSHAKKGAEEIKEVYGLLENIYANRSTYKQEAFDWALKTGLDILNRVDTAKTQTIAFVESMIAKGHLTVDETLTKLGQYKDLKVGEFKRIASDLLNKGGQIYEQTSKFIADVCNDPRKYANMGSEFVNGLKTELKTYVMQKVESGAMTLKQGFDKLSAMGAQARTEIESFLTDMLKKGGKLGTDALTLMTNVLNNPDEYKKLAREQISAIYNALSNAVDQKIQGYEKAFTLLVDQAKRDISEAGEKIKGLVERGKVKLDETLTQLAGMPPRIRAIVGQGIDTALKTGRARLEDLQYIANHPREVVDLLGEKGKEILVTTRDSLVKWVSARKTDVEGAMKALGKLYDEGSAYMSEVMQRTGKSIDKFEDTVFSLLKQGVDVGKESFDRFYAVGQKRLPELVSAWNNLQDAPRDLLLKVVKWDARGGEIIVDELAKLSMQGLNKAQTALMAICNETGMESAKQIVTALINDKKMSVTMLAGASTTVLHFVETHADANAIKSMINQGIINTARGIDILWNKGAQGFQALTELYQTTKSTSGEIIDFLSAKLKTAWDNSSLSNGYKGIRDLISEMESTAEEAGGTAMTVGKQMLYQALEDLNRQLGNALPDMVLSMIK